MITYNKILVTSLCCGSYATKVGRYYKCNCCDKRCATKHAIARVTEKPKEEVILMKDEKIN